MAPHTYQTVPLLHALLANTLSDSRAAIELLRGVRLLQYFDLPGLAESLGEISEEIYRRGRRDATLETDKAGSAGSLEDLILLQGMGPMVATAHRRSGLVQANALLAGLTRNIINLSRSSNNTLSLVETVIEMEATSGKDRDREASKSRRFAMGTELDSAFSSPGVRSMRLICGHETLSRTLESAFDRMVVVHDGFERVGIVKRGDAPDKDLVVEVTKDRLGDLTGFWSIWNSEKQSQS